MAMRKRTTKKGGAEGKGRRRRATDMCVSVTGDRGYARKDREITQKVTQAVHGSAIDSPERVSNVDLRANRNSASIASNH
jgi:hypothetical protein